MRKTILLLFLCLSVRLAAQDKKINVALESEPIATLFQQIQKQARYNVIYSDEVISDTMLVTISAGRFTVAELLNRILPPKNLSYRLLSDRTIVIMRPGVQANIPAAIRTIIHGGVRITNGQPAKFASVVMQEKGTIVSGSVSDESGQFKLTHDFIAGQTYTIRISSIGHELLTTAFTYPDTAKLKKLTLIESANTVKAVDIVGAKPLLERRADRYIVNVEGSVLANGNNSLELLQRSPGLWVDADGSIRIRGNQAVMVMINDVVQRMSSADLAEYLRTLRSEDVSRIEIISSPPSEFEAEGSGGIVHIVLKKNRRDGLTGSLSAQYRQQEQRPAVGAGAAFSYKNKDLYLFGGANGEKDQSDYIATNDITYQDQSRYSSRTNRYNNNMRYFYQLGGGYDLSDKQSIGFQLIHTGNQMDQYFNTHIDVSNSAEPLNGIADSEWFRRPKQTSATINYGLKLDSLGSGIKIIGDYVNSQKTELNNFTSVYTLASRNSVFRNNTPNTTKIYSLQADLTKVYRSGLMLKKGLKFAATTRDNEVLNEDLINGVWTVNTNLSNRFLYNEYLTMGYASLEKTIDNWSIKAGVRAEYTLMEGNSITALQKFRRDYLNLFPSIFLSRKFGKKENSSAYLSYAKRLQRPSFAALNPYRLLFDNYLTQLGNPDLLPEYTHKFEIGSMFWRGMSADIYYALTTNKIGELANPVSNNIIEYQPRNFDNSSEYGVSLNVPVKVAKWWRMNNSFVGYQLRYTLDNFRNDQTTFFGRTQNTLSFDGLFDLDMYAEYRSPFVRGNTRYAHVLFADMGILKRVANKTIVLRALVTDVFNTFREKNLTDYNNTVIDFYQKRPTRTLRIYISYNFSAGKKFSNKKIEQSNDEEKSRIGN